VGVFYQPRAVYIDTRVLLTLPEEEMLNGLAEVIKYGVIRDETFFDFLGNHRKDILRREIGVLEEVIARCCTIKAEVVAADEREADLRRILNFGHTIGHAVEAASGYCLAHGLAVAIGMIAAAELATAGGSLPRSETERLRGLVSAYGLPVSIPAKLDPAAIKDYLKTDKKAVSGRLFFVLPTRIGRVFITDAVSEELIERVIGELRG
jgi:3-dehydroquinate synthase